MRSGSLGRFHFVAWATLLALGLAARPATAAISEQLFHQILNLAERVYGVEFASRNLRFQLHRDWHRDEHRASASLQEDRSGRIAVVNITGGIARDPAITRDAFVLIVCHEVGHHLAGQPQRWGFSAEGQADYFAASECGRRLLPLLPDYATTAMQPIPRRLELECEQAFVNDDDAYLCLRIAVAGEALSHYFAGRKGLQPPDFLTPNTHRVNETRFLAGDPQCRLDTYHAAALCNPGTSHHQAPHMRWLCNDTVTQRAALRPACWYSG